MRESLDDNGAVRACDTDATVGQHEPPSRMVKAWLANAERVKLTSY